MERPHRASGRGATVIRQADDREPTPKPSAPQPLQPEWVPELIAVLIDLHRKRACRHAYAGFYARRRTNGQYPAQAA